MELTRGEVVIVDFHRFPSGFPLSDQGKLKEIHKMMLDKVKSKLGRFGDQTGRRSIIEKLF